MIRITMKDGGVIDLELDKKAAPVTVENFEKLVKDEFYDLPQGHSRIHDPGR